MKFEDLDKAFEKPYIKNNNMVIRTIILVFNKDGCR